MAKALILANSSSGLYDFRNELLLGLMDKGFDVVISLPDELKVKELKDEGCKVIHTDINRRGVNPIQDMALFGAYKKLLNEEKPDIVITYTIKPNIYGGFACSLLKIPYISTITGLGSTFERGGVLLKMIVAMYRISLKKCRCLFFQNDTNRKVFERNGIFARKHVTVSGSGVNLSKHKFEEYPGHKDDVTRFLYIGRLMKEKGTDEYLYAARKLHDKYGDKISFSAIGYSDDDYDDKVKEAVEKGYFKSIPYSKDIHPYIREADAIVHPSYHEGMSNVLMEAAATGRPVIASDISGCKEIVDNNVSGLLFKPRDEESLTEAIDRFMQLSMEERKTMGKMGRKWVEEHFDRHKVIGAYLNAIGDIVGS
ncbi:glycosyltransferase family 4 protein [Butyrivibrio sp. YAB3001]|uniref:glycosyltransferase family 4 protein n=1 Tax=Butyrivibrio sp. YAB3001 TaxID=1520812 RepID=UPI0008F6271B|nr:glycosyltransferase family 4 protein [Butyrivibrio sp. YAB3001]SFC76486.1 galacturonosyltransferase [Butyrivibrio sp. YAB3001]